MNAKVVVFTFLIEIILVLSAVHALLEKNTFWVIIAVWSSIVVWIPLSPARACNRPLISWIILLTVSIFFIDLILPNYSLLLFSSPWYWLSSTISIFALSLATMAITGRYCSLRMNRSFTMLLVYMLFESLVVIQGPIDYYSDILLATNQIQSNFSLMMYILLATIGGLLLTVTFYFISKNKVLANLSEHPLEVGEG